MNRSDLVRALKADGHLDPERIVDRIFSLVGASLAVGEPVSIRNFGIFEPRQRAAVTRLNPRTKEPVHVPEKISVGFRPAPALKARINRFYQQEQP